MAETETHPWRTTAVLALAVVGFAVQQTSVVPAVQDIEKSLHGSAEWSAWLITLYLIIATVATLVMGRLADLHGRRRLLLIGMAVFAVSSILAAFAPNMASLLVLRALQGVGGAVYPLALSFTRDELPEDRVTTGVSVLTAAFGVGSGIGLVSGGLFASYLSWRWIFVLGAVLVVVGGLLLWRFLPAYDGHAGGSFDLVGTVTLGAATTALLVALTLVVGLGWSSPVVIVLLCVAVLAGAGWVVTERTVSDPLIDLHILTKRSVVVANLGTVAVGWSMFSALLLVPQFARSSPGDAGLGLGAGSASIGLIMLPLALGQIGSALAAERAMRVIGSRAMLAVALVCFLAATGVLAVDRTSTTLAVVGTLLLGCGAGSGIQSASAVVTESVAADVASASTSFNSTVRRFAGGIGGQVSTILLTALAVSSLPGVRSFVTGYLIGGGLCLVALIGVAIETAAQRRTRRA